MSKLTSVFFGTPEFSLPSLEACHEGSRLLAIVSQPDKARGRGQKLLPSPVKAWAQKKGLRVFTPKSLKKPSPELDELIKFLEEQKPDIFAVTAYGNLLPADFLERPKLASVNVHASLLPRWRGAAPIQRALEAGDRIGGVSLQRMVFELDAGNVISEEKLEIPTDWNASRLSQALSSLGKRLLLDFFARLGKHANSPNELRELTVGTPQNPDQVTYAPKLSKEEGFWQPDWSAALGHNRIRAFEQWPKVQAELPGLGPIKLLESRLHYEHELSPEELAQVRALKPGEMHLLQKKLFLGTAVRTSEALEKDHEAFLELSKLQLPGKAATEALAWAQNFLRKAQTPVILKSSSLR